MSPPKSPHDDLDDRLRDAIRRVGAVALALPETREEDAWVGVRWRVRMHTFAHVSPIRDGRPEGYVRASRHPGPAMVLVFHAPLEEAQVFAQLGPPWFKPPWSPTVVGLMLTPDVDWEEVAEVVTDSYRVRAPRKLADLVD